MLSSYDMTEFSESLRALRTVLGFTIADVAKETGISASTIKHLETGKAVPRFETLHVLSNFYKVDVFTLFNQHQYERSVVYYFDQINTYMAINEQKSFVNALTQLLIHLNEDETLPIEHNDLIQLKLYIEGLILASKCINDNSPELEVALNKYKEALRIKNRSFEFETFNQYKFLSIEFNILFAAASLLGLKRQCALSNQILLYVVNYYDSFSNTNTHKLFKSKCYAIIAYNFHRMSRNEVALEYSDIGINYCIQNDTAVYLPLLLGRKSIALFHMKDPTWKAYMHQAIVLLEIQNRMELKKHYEKILEHHENTCA